MQFYIVFLIFSIVISQIFIINRIRNKIGKMDRAGKINNDMISYRERVFDDQKGEKMLEYRQILIRVNGYGR